MSRIDKNTDFFAYVDNFAKYKHVDSIRLYGEHKNISPKVSITIPTYRRPELLKEAVESAINQVGYDDYEIIIVDNDATGEFTEQIIEMLKSFASDKVVYYRNQENIGMFGNWNRCIELATGEWMTILSDDDIIFPVYLSELVNELEKDDTLDRVECRFHNFTDNMDMEKPLKYTIKYLISKIFLGRKSQVSSDMYLYGNFTSAHSQLYKRRNAYEIGGFVSKYYPYSDYVFNIVYLYKFPRGLYLNEFLCGYRWSENASLSKKVMAGFYFKGHLVRSVLLKQKNSVFRKFWSLYISQLELYLLDIQIKIIYKILRKLFLGIGRRLLWFYCLIIKVPQQLGN